MIPNNYFATNARFYSILVQRHCLHLIRGKTNLALAASFSSTMKYSLLKLDIRKLTKWLRKLI